MTLSIETAKRLKEAGYPDNNPSMWWRNDYPNFPGKYEDKWYLIADYDYPRVGERVSVKYGSDWHLIPAPTLSELIEACLPLFRTLEKNEDGWWAYGQKSEFATNDLWRTDGNTAEEAVAELYLTL